MNWFRANKFLGTFAIAGGVLLLVALWFWWSARCDWAEANARFAADAAELARLDRLNPFPSADNLRKMKVHAEDYNAGLNKLKGELQTRVLQVAPVQPDEFQSRLRIAAGAVAERARTNKVKLPENFFLGFDEFAAALPSTNAAPLLAQELAQIELLVNTMIDARVDAISAFRRILLNNERPAAAASSPANAARTPAPLAQPDEIERSVVETSFLSTPAAARRLLNAITAAHKQLYIIRLLHVRNEKEKGPAREVAGENAGAPSAGTAGKPAAALNFIVGNEKIEAATRIEILRFNL